LIFLGVDHSSFIPHLYSSLLHPFPLIFKSKARPIAPVLLLYTQSFPTVQVSAVRHVQAANWHGGTVPPCPWPFSSFLVFLMWVTLSSSISLRTYIKTVHPLHPYPKHSNKPSVNPFQNHY